MANPQKMGVYFDFGFYGQSNLEVEGGMRRFQKRFASNGEVASYSAALITEAGERFKSRVAERFAARHGRTGATARSIRDKQRWVAPGGLSDYSSRYVYSVIIEGNVGWVVNPINAHTITIKNAAGLANAQTGPWNGRNENFYSPFAPYYEGTQLREVPWYQGGPEGHSPDRSWYENDLELIADTYKDMSKISSRVVQLWGGGDKSFLSMPSKLPATNIFSLADTGF